VIGPFITNSRCKAPKSGLLIRIFLRRRNSLAGSSPSITGDLLSLETEAAREVDGLEAASRGRGVGAFEGVEDSAVTGGFNA
jgi:hypothetical protein